MPVAFWGRDTDPAATPSVPPKPPFEARGVDTIMKLRKAMTHSSGDAEVTPAIHASLPEEVSTKADTMSIRDRLEGQRPKDIKAWLDFRVSWLRTVFYVLWYQKLVCLLTCGSMTRIFADVEAHVMKRNTRHAVGNPPPTSPPPPPPSPGFAFPFICMPTLRSKSWLPWIMANESIAHALNSFCLTRSASKGQVLEAVLRCRQHYGA